MSKDQKIVLLATTNAGKRAEFRRLLPPDIHVLTLDDLGLTLPPEDGTTFAETASAKARFAASRGGMLTIADDSGLEVDALGGAPGLHSARYAGDGASDVSNREKLLTALRDVPEPERTARFRCAVAMADASGLVAVAEGTCEGVITTSPVGEHGFGYDPLFRLSCGRTMAELLPEEKNQISHRAKAYQAVLPALLSMLAPRIDSRHGGSR